MAKRLTFNKVINPIQDGQLAILPTDTLYGLVGSALNKKTVEKIYQLKQRTPDKPFIILISSLDDLKLFNISLSDKTKKFLDQIWPNPVSVILPCVSDQFFYLHRGTKSLAFRLPKNQSLLKLLKQTGPLVAPSANPENLPPAQVLDQTITYFGDQVKFYVDGGTLTSQPSTLIKLENDRVVVLREGAYKIVTNF